MTQWSVLPRTQLVKAGREISQRFGLKTNGWTVTPEATLAKSLARYAKQHPDDPSSRSVSPLALKLRFKADHADQVAEVRVDSAGLPLYWHAPEGFKPAQKFASEVEAATAAFHAIAGTQAAAFTGPVHSMGDESHSEEYVWKKPPAQGLDLRDRIKVITKDGVVESAERKPYFASDDEDDDNSGLDNQKFWSAISGIFGLLSTAVTVAIFSVYVLWLSRRVVAHRFPLRLSIAAAILMFAALPWSDGSYFGAFVAAVTILCFTAAGRGISAEARPKWISLEQLCFLAPISKSTAASMAAGVLLSPLLIAIPFLIAGLVPGSWVIPQNVELLYSRAPLLESLRVPDTLYLLGFFGFALPALQRMIRLRWLLWLIVLLLGTVFFADQPRVVSGLFAAPLAAGLITLLLFWFAYTCFDLLAVLVLHFAGGLLLTALMLAQKGGSFWTLLLALGGLFVLAYWFSVRGQEAAEGDPQASNPALVGFRAEREKLRAEFSVARRAQESMLPQTPPSVPGYSIAASCTPSLEVGGDLYDFLKLPDGRIGLGVADVSGKGVPAALYMTLTKGLMAAITKNNSQLASVVENVNRHLHGVTRKKVFVTMALGFLDPEKRVLECVRAGHNPMVWRQPSLNETTLVAPGGLGLGITAGRVFGAQLKVAELALTEGDAVVFYSDGITEAMNRDLEQFGEQRLMDAVKRTDRLDAAASRDAILAEVREFLGGVHPQDDMTLVVLRVGEAFAR
jgi:serine phosphatase RsbU (regulator of sigma subunit)